MSARLTRLFEWWLGLPSAGSGQGTSGRLVFGPAAGADVSLTTLGFVAAAAALSLIAVYLLQTGTLRAARRLPLLALRLFAATLVLLMLGRLSLQIERSALPTVAVLIDVSGSMGLTDRYEDARLARTVRTLIPPRGQTLPTRLQLVQALLTRDDARWWTALQESHHPQLFAFDDHLRPIVPAATGSSIAERAALVDAVRALTADGLTTAPAAAVRAVLDDFRGQSLDAVVLFSDGVASAGDDERLTRVAQLARERNVPLYCVAVGSRDPVRDLELFDLLAGDVAYLDEPYTLSLRHRSFGLQDQPTELTVTVDGESEPVGSQPIIGGPDRAALPLDMSLSLPEEGLYDLTITATPLAGEADRDNNVLHHRVEVRREPLRVLLVEGGPRWEYRALKPLLERDDTLQLETYLQSAEPAYLAEDRTALPTLPAAREQWERFDVVVWGDVDPAALPREVPAQLREFVTESGGGLLLIAGERHNPLDYAGTELSPLLPVSIGGAASVTNVAGAPLQFRLDRTPTGRGESFLRLSDSPPEDEANWQSLPAEMNWLLHTPDVKPGAEVLAVGPVLDGRAAPLIVRQRIGRGQVLYHGTDTLWTWRKRTEDRCYGRYWSQAVRAVAPRRDRGAGGWELTSDRRVYEPGDVVALRLRGPTSAAVDVDRVTIHIESLQGVGERFSADLARMAPDVAEWNGVVRDLPLGDFHAVAIDSTITSAAGCRFRCLTPDRERRDRAVALSDLEQAAQTSQGACISLADADHLPSRLPRGRTVRLSAAQLIPLWSRWEFVLILAAVLAAEWILRRRRRLL